MGMLRSCCLCFSTRTGSFVLGTLGIILGATLLAPMAIFLDYHSYYITQFVATERVGGNYIDDDQVPKMELFSKILFTALLTLDVIFVLSCVLLLAGIAGTRHLLMLPWLIFTAGAIIVQITLVISFMIAVADYGAVAIFLGSSPGLALAIYLWCVVYAAYQIVKKADTAKRGAQMGPGTGGSASQSSISSLKEGLHRVIGGSPPPPYEAVTTKPSPKQGNLCKTSSVVASTSSCSDLLPLSSNCSSRRASDEVSTKPVSPTSLPPRPSISSLGCKVTVPSPPSPAAHPTFPTSPGSLRSSQSHGQLDSQASPHAHQCPSLAQRPGIRRSQSTTQATQVEAATGRRLQEPLKPRTVQAPVPPLVRQEAVEVSCTSLLRCPSIHLSVHQSIHLSIIHPTIHPSIPSDDTSSMSSTSLSIPEQNLLC